MHTILLSWSADKKTGAIKISRSTIAVVMKKVRKSQGDAENA